MMACLLGLFRTERLASEMSAVTRVMEILRKYKRSLTDQIILAWREKKAIGREINYSIVLDSAVTQNQLNKV